MSGIGKLSNVKTDHKESHTEGIWCFTRNKRFSSLTPHFSQPPPWQSLSPRVQQTLKPQTPVKIEWYSNKPNAEKVKFAFQRESENLADPPLLAPVSRSALGEIGAAGKISETHLLVFIQQVALMHQRVLLVFNIAEQKKNPFMFQFTKTSEWYCSANLCPIIE